MIYRQDIDGLRAIAVISVIAYHLGVTAIPGGFVGVDIFFVISGYVILRAVLPSINEGSFKKKEFIINRLYRIQPALFTTLILSLTAALLILTPAELSNFSKALLSAAIGVSNIHFNDVAGNYFAPFAESSPLLHTWSLGVEWQFYFLAPFIFYYATQRRSISAATPYLVIILLLSFVINIYDVFISGSQSKSFYLPTHRFWEFSIGAIIAVYENRIRSFGEKNYSWMPTVGLLGITASILFIEKNQSFPGLAALFPTISTAIVIIFSQPGSAIYKFLTNRIMVFLGKISFSLYLAHWPAIVFYRLATGKELDNLAIQTGIFLLSLLIATLMWRYIESPTRKIGKTSSAHPFIHFGLPVILLSAVSLVITKSNGLPDRLNTAARTVYENSIEIHQSDCNPIDTWHQKKASICGNLAQKTSIDFLFWGDSHAGMLRPALLPELTSNGKSTVFATMADCVPLLNIYTSKIKNREECAELSAEIKKRVSLGQIKTVILVSRWANVASSIPAPSDGQKSKSIYKRSNGSQLTFENSIIETASILRSAGANVVIIGPVPEINFNVPETLIRSLINDFNVPETLRYDFDQRQSEVISALHSVETMNLASVIMPHQHFCDESICKTYENLNPFYLDDDHLNNYGSRELLPLITSKLLQIAE